MNGNSNWQMCPACQGEGAQAHVIVNNGRAYGRIVVQCVWCHGQGAVSPSLVEQFFASHMEVAFKIRNAHNN